MPTLDTFRHQRSRLYRRAHTLRLLLIETAEDNYWIRRSRAETPAEWLAQRVAELLESADRRRKLRLVEAAIGSLAACVSRLDGVRRRLPEELRNRLESLLISIYEDLTARRDRLHELCLGRAPVLEPLSTPGAHAPSATSQEASIVDESEAKDAGASVPDAAAASATPRSGRGAAPPAKPRALSRRPHGLDADAPTSPG